MANRIIITKENANELLGFNDMLLVSRINENEFRVGEAYLNEDSNDDTDRLALKAFKHSLNVTTDKTFKKFSESDCNDAYIDYYHDFSNMVGECEYVFFNSFNDFIKHKDDVNTTNGFGIICDLQVPFIVSTVNTWMENELAEELIDEYGCRNVDDLMKQFALGYSGRNGKFELYMTEGDNLLIVRGNKDNIIKKIMLAKSNKDKLEVIDYLYDLTIDNLYYGRNPYKY